MQRKLACFALSKALPHPSYSHAAGPVFVVGAPLKSSVPADGPSFTDSNFTADRQQEVCLILHVAHLIGVGRIAQIPIPQFRFRSRKGVFHPCPYSVTASCQIAFEFHAQACAEIVVMFAFHNLSEGAGVSASTHQPSIASFFATPKFCPMETSL